MNQSHQNPGTQFYAKLHDKPWTHTTKTWECTAHYPSSTISHTNQQTIPHNGHDLCINVHKNTQNGFTQPLRQCNLTPPWCASSLYGLQSEWHLKSIAISTIWLAMLNQLCCIKAILWASQTTPSDSRATLTVSSIVWSKQINLRSPYSDTDVITCIDSFCLTPVITPTV